MAILEKIYKEPNHEISKTYNQIGTLLYSFSYFEDAITNFEKARGILEDCEIKNKDLELGYLYNNLAACYRAQKDTAKALELYEKAYDIFTGNKGLDDATVAVILNNKGTILKQAGDLEGAIKNYKASL